MTNTLSGKLGLENKENSAQDLDFSVATELESVVERVKFRLRFWRGEYYLDGNQGVPYLGDVLGHQVDLSLAQQAITDQIASVADVLAVSDVVVEIDSKSRTLRYSASVSTVWGDARISVVPAAVVADADAQVAVDASADDLGDFWTAGDAGGFWRADNFPENNHWTAT